MYGLSSDFQKRNIAIYARVSTEHEAQLSALENQLDWYKPILEARPEWTLKAQYIDEGITGTSAEKRPQFLRMIEDAKDHNFDMIITREVSRFARNTVDTLQYTRMLKEYGVEVFFLNDNIKTFDGDGELRLTIMATLAQDESRKTSIRVKAGQQTSMNNGVFYGNGNILGYTRYEWKEGDKKHVEMRIDPEQAKTVRMIYDMYLGGMGVTKIQYELEAAGRLTSTGKKKWHASYIAKLLKNSFYCGIITYHKEFTPDYLKQKKIKNMGEIELTQVKGTHEPIVTEEEYFKVLEITEQRSKVILDNKERKRTVGARGHSTIWGRLLVCQCGHKFNQRTHTREGRHDGTDYQCYNSANNGSIKERIERNLTLDGTCDSPYIQGWKLDLMAKRIFSDYVSTIPEVLETAYKMLEEHIADTPKKAMQTDLLENLETEIKKLNNRRNNLIEMRADGDIDKDTFRERKEAIEKEIASVSRQVEELKEQLKPEEPKNYALKLSSLKARLKDYTDIQDNELSDNVIEAFIEKIFVTKDEFRWYLRNNKETSNIEPIQVASFTLTQEDGKNYLYSFSTRRRVFNWKDLNVTVWA